MTVQIVSAARALTGRAARRIIGRCALAAIGASFAAISIGAFGADQETGYSNAVFVPSHSAPFSRRPIPARPVSPPDTKPDHSVQHTQIVDQLYEKLMRSSGCSLASNHASMAGGC